MSENLSTLLTAYAFVIISFGIWIPVAYFRNRKRFNQLVNPCPQEVWEYKQSKRLCFWSSFITIVIMAIIAVVIYT